MNHYDILIIDDESGIRDILSELAQSAGFKAKTAESAKAGLEILSDFPRPPLIISDISMPGMDGLDLLQKLKSDAITSAVVMLTAHSESEKIIVALRLGAIDYIQKPFDAKKLMANFAVWVEIGNRLQSLPGELNKQLRMIELFKIKNKVSQTF